MIDNITETQVAKKTRGITSAAYEASESTSIPYGTEIISFDKKTKDGSSTVGHFAAPVPSDWPTLSFDQQALLIDMALYTAIHHRAPRAGRAVTYGTKERPLSFAEFIDAIVADRGTRAKSGEPTIADKAKAEKWRKAGETMESLRVRITAALPGIDLTECTDFEAVAMATREHVADCL